MNITPAHTIGPAPGVRLVYVQPSDTGLDPEILAEGQAIFVPVGTPVHVVFISTRLTAVCGRDLRPIRPELKR